MSPVSKHSGQFAPRRDGQGNADAGYSVSTDGQSAAMQTSVDRPDTSSPGDWPTIAVRLSNRIGGPLGRHVNPGGPWFDPAPWALLLAAVNWVVLLWRQAPCQQYTFGKPVNPFLRLCYSDIPVFFQNNGIGAGAGIFSDAASPLPALVGYLAWLNRLIVKLLGGGVGPDASGQAQLDASYMFFVLSAVGLFCAFLALVLAHLQIGRDSHSVATGGVRVRSFDALLIAAAPVVLASGLISWEILPVALTSLALWAWTRKLPVVAGVLFGLAVSAGAYALLVVLAIVVLCLRAARMGDAWRMLGPGALVWAVVNLPVIIVAPHGWTAYWSSVVAGGTGPGSFWYILQLQGVSSTLLGIIASVLVIVAIVALVWLALVAPQRPRVGQLAFLIVAALAVLGPHYSPQYALWLLPLVVLARPKVFDWAVWNIAEVVYWLAIWGFMEGILGAGSGADALYWLAVLLRIGVVLWLAAKVISDIFNPWNDPVRRPFVDDPAGGVLDHAVDAPWLAEPARPVASDPVASDSAPSGTAVPGQPRATATQETGMSWPPIATDPPSRTTDTEGSPGQ